MPDFEGGKRPSFILMNDTLSTFLADSFRRADRTIWMDGRPHPSKYAPHTWAGFTTGEWRGSTLVTTTTHLKWGWVRRNC